MQKFSGLWVLEDVLMRCGGPDANRLETSQVLSICSEKGLIRERDRVVQIVPNVWLSKGLS